MNERAVAEGIEELPWCAAAPPTDSRFKRLAVRIARRCPRGKRKCDAILENLASHRAREFAVADRPDNSRGSRAKAGEPAGDGTDYRFRPLLSSTHWSRLLINLQEKNS